MVKNEFADLAPDDRIAYKPRARRELRKISPKKQQGALLDAIESLVENPYPPGCRKLVNGRGEYRIRVGSYRVIYEVLEGQVLILVLRIGPRGGIYQD